MSCTLMQIWSNFGLFDNEIGNGVSIISLKIREISLYIKNKKNNNKIETKKLK